MADECDLRASVGHVGRHCDGESCVYWRVVGHLGVTPDGEGCAIKHFELLDGGHEVTEWLLSVKNRVEEPPGHED